MKELIENIVEKINFKKKQSFGELLKKCFHVSNDSIPFDDSIGENLVFRIDELFKGFPSFISEFGKDKKYEAGVEALSVICSELNINIDKAECFIVFHIRNLGKFKILEPKLHEELKFLWRQYKSYALEDRDFSYSLKSLMKMGFINYRKRGIHINKAIIVKNPYWHK